jgi:hypothetical protein
MVVISASRLATSPADPRASAAQRRHHSPSLRLLACVQRPRLGSAPIAPASIRKSPRRSHWGSTRHLSVVMRRRAFGPCGTTTASHAVNFNSPLILAWHSLDLVVRPPANDNELRTMFAWFHRGRHSDDSANFTRRLSLKRVFRRRRGTGRPTVLESARRTTATRKSTGDHRRGGKGGAQCLPSRQRELW